MGEVKLPEDVKEQLEKFEAAVQEMEEGLTPLLSADRKEMEAALNPLSARQGSHRASQRSQHALCE